MPKKSKVGKQRKDKFYRLAKETGFRSRASFKLIQLNRKFEFLQKSRVLVDLCAAPGGWLQVAHQAMPVSSLIIGIDLVPIRPIPNVMTFQEDITTEKCRQTLKRELKTFKVDTVLHDGAPNVGKSWLHDAFTQNQLTLHALKLASELLVKGGWFITKVFRSKDYFSLVWVFKKLFKRVHVTKPQASRNESAEIFIVCQGYSAPDRIDPKFLDGSYLFKDVQATEETKNSIDRIVKPKLKPEGYDDELIYAQLKASDFIMCENHLERLSKCSEIIFDDDDIRDHTLTTEEIRQCCKDIKVLGKADLKSLLSWRKKLRLAILGADDQKKVSSKPVEDVEEKEIDEAVKEAEDIELSKLQDAKRKKKKILKERKKLHDRMNLKMIIKDDEPVIQEDRELFKLDQIKNPKDLTRIEDDDNLEFSLEPQNNDVNDVLDVKFRKLHTPYNRDDRNEPDVEEEPVKEESIYSSDGELSSDIEFESDDDIGSDAEPTEAILEGKKNPLVVDLVDRPDRVKDTVNRWFDKEEFMNAPEDSDLELDLLAETLEKKSTGKRAQEKGMKNKDVTEKKTEENTENSVMEEDMETTGASDPGAPKKKHETISKKEKRKKRVRLDPEGLALGSMMVQSKKMKRDIIENSYNRYSSNDENLPSWFVSDEKKHYRKQLPVTAELVAEYKQRLKEINARPIKKVVEAKARKKRKSERRLEKAKKRAEKVTDHPDMSEKEKAEELKTIYKKAIPKKDTNVTYVVAKKGGGRRVSRPAGVKGRFKVVDRRMKKDMKKMKEQMKNQRHNHKAKNFSKKNNARKTKQKK
ncbi:pre-rRNA 2'-O-ribose RNA methyltransferase FTSJ3-like [Uloborus diversus]|uniref:pre-rRNA 2'-O-ribose RNA methyltransferase FTSJ3-like n=1 Tax=Uloborus diversus TaxID=327109 RepID=UPI00240A7FCE|nr:pre-rRNA 2'-O-ribose RNA methyltransferase FTSJ3-like [Uloborus diversus]